MANIKPTIKIKHVNVRREIIDFVRNKMVTIKRFTSGDVFNWFKQAGLQGLAVIHVYEEFISRERRAGRVSLADDGKWVVVNA